MSNFQTSNQAYGSYLYRGGSNTNQSSIRNSQPKPNVPLGLYNLTNTCYISACLQILFLILPQKLIQNKGKITEMFMRLKKTHDKYDYKILKKELQSQIQIVNGWDQQDAQQFLLSFLQVLNNENNNPIGKSSYTNFKYNEKDTAESNWKKFQKEMQKIQNSEIINLFYGEILRQIQCKKKHIKHVFQRYINLSLSFPQQKSTYSPYSYSSYNYNSTPVYLKQLIQKQLIAEEINEFQCESCGKKTQAKKLNKFYTIPKYVIIHLGRFKKGYFKNQKISTHVTFEETITIKQERIGSLAKFKLVGVINHVGTLDRGHYYSHGKLGDKWYQFDDQDVKEIPINDVIGSSKYAYILFYEKIQ